MQRRRQGLLMTGRIWPDPDFLSISYSGSSCIAAFQRLYTYPRIKKNFPDFYKELNTPGEIRIIIAATQKN